MYRNGELVVDAVAGVADPESGRAVTQDTPFYNFSIVKGATGTIAHMLAERGLLNTTPPSRSCGPNSPLTASKG